MMYVNTKLKAGVGSVLYVAWVLLVCCCWMKGKSGCCVSYKSCTSLPSLSPHPPHTKQHMHTNTPIHQYSKTPPPPLDIPLPQVTLLLSSIPRTAPSLILSGQPTHLLPSTAPLADQHGNPLPTTSTMQNTTSNTSFMHALYLHDQQVLIRPMFDHFPTTEVTVELWMSSVDPCGEGVPFSYAAGGYGVLDNALLLFNYNNWCVGVRVFGCTYLCVWGCWWEHVCVRITNHPCPTLQSLCVSSQSLLPPP